MARYDDFDDDYYSDRVVRKKPAQTSRTANSTKNAKKTKSKRKKSLQYVLSK